MTEVIIRSAAEHDLPEVLNLYRHLHPHDPELETATAERVWSKLLTSGFVTVIVAQAAKRLVSSCTLAIMPNLSRGGRSYGVIENVVTHADYRRLGLGRRVLVHALDIAWQADCYKVLLATGSKRETTLRFYEEAGFQRGGKTYFEVRRPWRAIRRMGGAKRYPSPCPRVRVAAHQTHHRDLHASRPILL
jgi:ribosomal protein S18 acetylase RimI-like enzyme